MRSRVDPRLREEAARFGFLFSCEACAHFDSNAGSCVNGYSNQDHRSALLDERESLEFCKEFELF